MSSAARVSGPCCRQLVVARCILLRALLRAAGGYRLLDPREPSSFRLCAAQVSAFWNAQMQAYLQPGSAGWIIWSLKMEGGGIWSLKTCYDNVRCSDRPRPAEPEHATACVLCRMWYIVCTGLTEGGHGSNASVPHYSVALHIRMRAHRKHTVPLPWLQGYLAYTQLPQAPPAPPSPPLYAPPSSGSLAKVSPDPDPTCSPHRHPDSDETLPVLSWLGALHEH